MLEPVGTAALADQLRNGDPEAFSKLLDLYGASMQRVARGYVSSSELAEDVVQETWIAVFKGIDKFEGRASLRTWIFTILINVAKKRGLAERRYTDTAVRVMTGGTVDPDRFRDAGEFFTAYGTVPALVRDLDDLAALCLALVHAEAHAGVLYLEPSIEPQLYSPRLGDLDTVTRTIVDALQRGAAETGIEVGANLTVNTGLEAVLAEDLARLAARFVGAGITAFGTAGPDDPTGPRRFERAARVARDAGLQVVIHAGQTGGPVDGPASVRAALDVLGATRISHGVHAIHVFRFGGVDALGDESLADAAR